MEGEDGEEVLLQDHYVVDWRFVLFHFNSAAESAQVNRSTCRNYLTLEKLFENDSGRKCKPLNILDSRK